MAWLARAKPTLNVNFALRNMRTVLPPRAVWALTIPLEPIVHTIATRCIFYTADERTIEWNDCDMSTGETRLPMCSSDAGRTQFIVQILTRFIDHNHQNDLCHFAQKMQLQSNAEHHRFILRIKAILFQSTKRSLFKNEQNQEELA